MSVALVSRRVCSVHIGCLRSRTQVEGDSTLEEMSRKGIRIFFQSLRFGKPKFKNLSIFYVELNLANDRKEQLTGGYSTYENR